MSISTFESVDNKRWKEGDELPELNHYKTRQDVVRVCKRIVRRLGHLMPKGAWLETFSWPGVRLTARCRHCSRIFSLAGNPDVGKGKFKPAPLYREGDEPGFIAVYELQPWYIFEIISMAADNETQRAFKEKVRDTTNERIQDVGPRDWEKSQRLPWAIPGVGFTPSQIPEPEIFLDEEAKEHQLVEKKLSSIEKRYYCEKVKTWL